MRLIELVVQGIKGWPAQARVSLAAGHCVLRAPATAQLRPVLDSLFFYDGRPKAEDGRLEAPDASVVRAGVTFLAKDSFTYRLVRDLRGGAALHRLDPATGKFVPFTSDALEIGQYLRTSVGLPPRPIWGELFSIAADRLPTLRDWEAEAAAQNPKPLSGLKGPEPKGGGHGGHGAHAPKAADVKFRGFQGFDEAEKAGGGGLSHEQAVKRLEQCKGELENAKKTESLQFVADGIGAKLFEFEEKIKTLTQADSELGSAKKTLAPFAALDALPSDLSAKLTAFDTAGARRNDAIAKVDAERDALEERRAHANPIPVQSDPRFLGALGAGVAFLLAGIFSPWKPLALLDIPAFGVAAWFALVFVGELQSRDGVARKIALLEERLKKIEAQFKADTAEIGALLKKLEIERSTELAERIGQRDQLRAKVNALQERVDALRQDPAVAGALDEQKKLRAEQQELERQIQSLNGGGFLRAAADVEAEVKRLELQVAGGPTAPEKKAEPAPGVVAPPKPTGPDPSAKLLERAADLFQLELTELAPGLAPRIAQYLTALADKRYGGVEIAGGGLVCTASGGRRLAFPELPGRDQDLAWVAIQLTVLERYSARSKLPLVLDDPFSFLDGPHQELAGKMVKYLGTLTQVVHRTTHAPLVASADATVDVA